MSNRDRPLLAEVLDAAAAAQERIDAEASRRAASARYFRMAHWAFTLEEATWRASCEAYERFWPVCPLPVTCAPVQACMWAHERMWRVQRARNACEAIGYPRIARTL